MRITKHGHCCLLIQTDNLTILTDPGSFSDTQNSIKGIDVILITHEHGDHLHLESVSAILAKNPNAEIVTNAGAGVGAKLAEKGIAFTVLEGTDGKIFNGVPIEAFDCKHEEIFEEIGQVQNTGYMIDNRLFYPGDSFGNPGKPIEILALPVAGPWCRMTDALHYAIYVKPKYAFPVHDAVINPSFISLFHKMPEMILGKNGIAFVSMIGGDEREF
jgi:L-ascorbate metabolism protein UlaG (beta-lactamase superfamily)